MAEPAPPTLSRVVQRAVEVVDPDGHDEAAWELFTRFEDRDEPVTAVADIEDRLAEAARTIDAELDSPALEMATAVATYLAHRRDQLDDDADDILRLAARAEYDGNPPDHLRDWLAAAGVEI